MIIPNMDPITRAMLMRMVLMRMVLLKIVVMRGLHGRTRS